MNKAQVLFDAKPSEAIKHIVSSRDPKSGKLTSRTAFLLYAEYNKIFYGIDIEIGSFIFPIYIGQKKEVGSARFKLREKATALMRYVRRALKYNEFYFKPSEYETYQDLSNEFPNEDMS